jgi:hypothetical protein
MSLPALLAGLDTEKSLLWADCSSRFEILDDTLEKILLKRFDIYIL